MQKITRIILTSITTISLLGCKPPLFESDLSEEKSSESKPKGTPWKFKLELSDKGYLKLVGDKIFSDRAHIKSIKLKTMTQKSPIDLDKTHYTKPFVFEKLIVIDPSSQIIAFSSGDMSLSKETTGTYTYFKKACEFESRGKLSNDRKTCLCNDSAKSKVTTDQFFKFTEVKAVCANPAKKQDKKKIESKPETTVAFQKACESYNDRFKDSADEIDLKNPLVEYNIIRNECSCLYDTFDRTITYESYKKLKTAAELHSAIKKLQCPAHDGSVEAVKPQFE